MIRKQMREEHRVRGLPSRHRALRTRKEGFSSSDCCGCARLPVDGQAPRFESGRAAPGTHGRRCRALVACALWQAQPAARVVVMLPTLTYLSWGCGCACLPVDGQAPSFESGRVAPCTHGRRCRALVACTLWQAQPAAGVVVMLPTLTCLSRRGPGCVVLAGV